MTNLEKAYYDKWLEQVKLNKELKLKIEKYETVIEEDRLFKVQYNKYKRCFSPLANNYKKLYSWSSELNYKFLDLITLFNKYILLNPNFNIKLSYENQVEIIKETSLIIAQYLKMQKMPKEYDIE